MIKWFTYKITMAIGIDICTKGDSMVCKECAYLKLEILEDKEYDYMWRCEMQPHRTALKIADLQKRCPLARWCRC